MTTTIKSTFGKTLRFQKFGPSEVALKPTYWGIKNPDPQPDALFKAEDLIGALKAEGFLNGEFITDLPEATETTAAYDTRNVVKSGRSSFYVTVDPAKVLADAKDLLAIHKFLVEKQAKEAEVEAQRIKEAELAAEAAKKAEEARNWRRDQLVMEIRGFGDYTGSSHIFQKAIDRIIALETATA